MVNFHLEDQMEYDIISAIAERAYAMAKKSGVVYSQRDIAMDVTATWMSAEVEGTSKGIGF